MDFLKIGMNGLLAFASTALALIGTGAFNGDGWRVALFSAVLTGIAAFAKEYQSECSGQPPTILPSFLVF